MLATLGCQERGVSHRTLGRPRERVCVALIHQHSVGANLIRWRRERCASEGDKEAVSLTRERRWGWQKRRHEKEIRRESDE